MSGISENILKILLLAIVLFVTFNMYSDISAYFYTKEISIFDDFLKII